MLATTFVLELAVALTGGGKAAGESEVPLGLEVWRLELEVWRLEAFGVGGADLRAETGRAASGLSTGELVDPDLGC